MSFLDPEDHALVLSVVFDGPPEAGKTTSVRALARGFGRPVETPAEHEGRTVFFDRLEHRAGVFEGSPIRLHIVSVPGQKRWARRRSHFIADADVVVFVGDTTRAAFDTSVAALADLRRELDARPGPPVGVVFQANKRDRADAVPIDEVAKRVGSERVAIFETSAADGAGVREVLVFAVKLALDRVRAGAPLDIAFAEDPRLATARELEALLRGVEGSALDESRTSASASFHTDGARTADEVHDGLVWPPVEGRILLAEATRTGVDLRAATAGDRVLGLGADWRLHSSADAVFRSIDDGRDALVAWARLHTKARDLVSPRRCIVLFETADSHWRLWQVVHREPNLRELEERGPLGVVAALRHVLAARAACRTIGVELPCTLDTLGARDDGRVQYVGPIALSRTTRIASANATLDELTLDLANHLATTSEPAASLLHAVAELLAEVRTIGEQAEVLTLLENRLRGALTASVTGRST